MKKKLVSLGIAVVMIAVAITACVDGIPDNPFLQLPRITDDPAIPVSYTIVIDMIDNEAGDTVTAAPETGEEGDTITLEFTVADNAHYNLLSFSGVNAPIAAVDNAGSGSRTYTVNADDAIDETIIIIATFVHTNLTPDPITFTDPAPIVTKTYGDAVFTNAVCAEHSGTGAITYSSSDETVAEVDNAGEVTIHKVGSAVITASKEADAVYAHASASYTLHIVPKPVTIRVTVNNKTYDGTTTAPVTGTTIDDNLDGTNLTAVTGTATFANANVGNGKAVTFNGWSLGGSAADNYTLQAQPAGATANITAKALTVAISGELSPVDTTATVIVNGLVGSDTATVSITTLTTGLTFNTGTRTLTYNGTTAYTNPTVTLNFTAGAGSNYTIPSTGTTTLYVRDGQANYTGSGNDRRIPVTQANITRANTGFNAYARTTLGLTRHYKLTENVTLTGTNNWTAIGTFTNWSTTSTLFTGSFNGQGNTITGLNINRATESGQGMFGYISNGSVVQNLGLVDVSVIGDSNVGGVVGVGIVISGNVRLTVQNCYTTGSVTGNYTVGGVVGFIGNGSTIQNCYSTCSVSGGSSGYVGGVVGFTAIAETGASLSYLMQNCYATGSVSGSSYVGGVMGNMNTVQNCVALNAYVMSSGSSSSLGRVGGSGIGSNSNHYARSTGMTLTYNNGVTYTPTPALNGKDGASTTAYNTQTFWTTASNWYNNTAWDFTNVWQWNSTTNLPVLRGFNQAQNHTVP